MRQESTSPVVRGDALRLARELAGVSQRELGRRFADAMRAGWSEAACARMLSRVELADSTRLEPRAARILALALDVELDELAVPPVCCRECGRPRRLG